MRARWLTQTCFNSVDVPPYETAAQLTAKFDEAIATAQQQGGFQFA